MRYEEFRAAWDLALRESKLGTFGFDSEETLNTRTTDRSYEVHVEPLGGQDARPFHVTATLSFRWDALHTARAATTEEDMLVTLFGRDGAADLKTDKPWLRVDIKLSATLPWETPMPMPSNAAWARWVREVTGRLDNIEPLTPEEKVRENEEGNLEVLAWQDVPSAECVCSEGGDLLLRALTISAFQILETPRHFDDPVQEDDGPEEQLREMFHRVRASLSAWMQALDHLKKR
ncbi:MAG: hypothetical protein IPM35_18610 [Myxococcales bacterium]|nr:hypothetical protein [Myxococcales bacterium]